MERGGGAGGGVGTLYFRDTLAQLRRAVEQEGGEGCPRGLMGDGGAVTFITLLTASPMPVVNSPKTFAAPRVRLAIGVPFFDLPMSFWGVGLPMLLAICCAFSLARAAVSATCGERGWD